MALLQEPNLESTHMKELFRRLDHIYFKYFLTAVKKNLIYNPVTYKYTIRLKWYEIITLTDFILKIFVPNYCKKTNALQKHLVH